MASGHQPCMTSIAFKPSLHSAFVQVGRPCRYCTARRFAGILMNRVICSLTACARSFLHSHARSDICMCFSQPITLTCNGYAARQKPMAGSAAHSTGRQRSPSCSLMRHRSIKRHHLITYAQAGISVVLPLAAPAVICKSWQAPTKFAM